MKPLPLEDAIVIVIRPEESRPIVRGPLHPGDAERSAQWIATHPALLDLVIRALRLAAVADEVLDRMSVAAGDEPGDDSWLEAWSRVEPAELRKMLAEDVE